MADVLQQAVGDEVSLLWRQNDAEQLFLEAEGCYGTHHHSDNHSYQAAAQFVEMVPKGHGFNLPICQFANVLICQ